MKKVRITKIEGRTCSGITESLPERSLTGESWGDPEEGLSFVMFLDRVNAEHGDTLITSAITSVEEIDEHNFVFETVNSTYELEILSNEE